MPTLPNLSRAGFAPLAPALQLGKRTAGGQGRVRLPSIRPSEFGVRIFLL